MLTQYLTHLKKFLKVFCAVILVIQNLTVSEKFYSKSNCFKKNSITTVLYEKRYQKSKNRRFWGIFCVKSGVFGVKTYVLRITFHGIFQIQNLTQ